MSLSKRGEVKTHQKAEEWSCVCVVNAVYLGDVFRALSNVIFLGTDGMSWEMK